MSFTLKSLPYEHLRDVTNCLQFIAHIMPKTLPSNENIFPQYFLHPSSLLEAGLALRRSGFQSRTSEVRS